MHHDKQLHYARLVSVVAATFISLACGSNYVFSAWGPQFAARMHLSSTEANLVATFGNLGMYLCGIPVGIMVDARGPKPGTLVGALLVGFGYWMLHLAYKAGPGEVPLPLLCIYHFCTGLGGCMGFAGAIKTSALNWPRNRGTATAFPLAAFGLSAFFFASISAIAAPNDAGKFLFILSVGCFSLIFIPFFFLRVVPHHGHDYKPVSSSSTRRLSRIESNGSGKALLQGQREPGKSTSLFHIAFEFLPVQTARFGILRQTDASAAASSRLNRSDDHNPDGLDDVEDGEDYDALLEEAAAAEPLAPDHAHKSVYSDVRGAHMLKYTEFYQYFALMGLLTGIGLMTINNIGSDAQALWAAYDPSTSLETIRARQSIHVSVLSFCSFLGRLLSGIGSDLVVSRLHLSRTWCLFASSLIFLLAQVCGLSITNPHFLFLLSGLTGLAYGFLFGCFPSTIAETFGVQGLSTNWGVLTLAPVIFANVFNLMYGRIYDSHSHVRPDHKRECLDGRQCYHEAYWGTFGASVLAAAIALWSIWHQREVKNRIGWSDHQS